jgi:hypothetical protein
MSFRSKLSRANKHSVYDLIQKRQTYLEKNLSIHNSTLNQFSINDVDVSKTEFDIKSPVHSGTRNVRGPSPKNKRYTK